MFEYQQKLIPDIILTAYMRIEEETVRAPREWLGPPIQMIVRRYLWQMATILFLEVLFMFSMFGLNITYPGNDSGS